MCINHNQEGNGGERIHMGRIDVILPDELEHKLRMEAGRRLGAKRGAFTEAITDAIALWLQDEVKATEIRKKAEAEEKKKVTKK